IDRAHQIFVVIAGVVVLDDVAEILSVSRAAARVRIDDYVTLCGHPLKLVIKDPAVRRMRSAVNVKYERVLLISIEIRWLLHPGLNLLAIKTRVPDRFRLS